jgi:hypothetical protein
MALEGIRSQLRAKESEVARLRGQRDVLREENDMRKAQQAVSSKASKEIEEFAQFQEVSGVLCRRRDLPAYVVVSATRSVSRF